MRSGIHDSHRGIKCTSKIKDSQKFYCLGASCHLGCKKTADTCPNSHKPITSTAGLDWTVAALILRRGGLRWEKKILADQVDARIAALRQQARDNEAAKEAKAGTGKAGESATDCDSTTAGFLPACFSFLCFFFQRSSTELKTIGK